MDTIRVSNDYMESNSEEADGHKMHRHVDWMNPSDREIVRALDHGQWMKPSSIRLNVGYSQYTVQERARVLTEHGLLKRHPETAAYSITDLGHQYLRDELSPEDLQDLHEDEEE